MAYCTTTDVYRLAGVTTTEVASADVSEHILEAQAWVDRQFNTTFETKQITETFDGTGNNEIIVSFFPIVTVDAVTIDGTSVTTSLIYVYTKTGKLVLKNTAEVQVWKNNLPLQNVIQYTYGYNYNFSTFSNTDTYFIRKLTASIAAMSALIEQIGGTFDDVTSYSIPSFSASKGEPFTNIRETVQRLKNQVDKMMDSQQFRSIARNSFFA